MRRAARTDANHAAIVEAFERLGCSVWDTHALGGGGSDIVVGKNRKNILVEIKDGAKPPSKRVLTPDEVDFHAHWRGRIVIVTCIEDVLAVVKELGG